MTIALLRRLAGEDPAPEMPPDQYVFSPPDRIREPRSRFATGQLLTAEDLNEMLDRICSLERQR
jgi:hypothetical protein